MLINTLFYSKNGEGLTHIIVFIFIAFIVGFIVVKFDPTRNLNIILTDDGISINEFKYQWGNIYKTYIVSRPVGEVYSYFLILALDTGVTDRYEFTGLMGFNKPHKKLSAYIEFYKNLTKQFSANLKIQRKFF